MDHERDIQALLSQLSEGELALFEEYFQDQLQEALHIADDAAQASAAGAADPLVVEADLVEEIVLLAEGRSPESQGLGFVPIPGGVMHLVPPQRNPFEAAPDTQADAGAPAQGLTQRRRMLLAGSIVMVAALLLFLTMPESRSPPPTQEATSGNPLAAPAASARPSAAAGVEGARDPYAPEPERIGPEVSPTPLVDAQVRRAKAAYPTSLEIVVQGEETSTLTSPVRSALVYRVLPSTGQLGGRWAPDIEPGTAAWLSNSYVNAVFCLPPDTEETLRALPVGTTVLMRPATGDVRAYAVVRVLTVGRQQTEVMSQRRAGMTLIACGTAGNERVVAEAVYKPPVSRELPPLAAQGNELPGYLRVDVQDLEAEPIPNTQLVRFDVSVVLRNLSTGEVRWTDLTDRLLINGQAARSARRVEWAPLAPGAERMETYSYVVPRSTQHTLWQVIAPTGESIDLQVVVPTVEE